MEHNFREWDVISNDPNGLEVTDEQLRATNNQFQQQQKFDRTEDELMLLGDEDDSLEPEKMDDQMEEELLGRASAVSTNKLTSAIKLNNEKTGKNERPKGIKSMFGAKYEENYKRFQYNLYGAPPVEPIQFGGGMDLSLMSNKSGGSINNSSSGTMTGNRSDGKAKAKKSGTVATKSAMGKRILKRKVVQNPVAKKASTDMSKKWGGQNVANRLKKRRSRSLDTALNSKWNTSSSFLDVTSSTDHSSFFEDRKMSRPIVGQNCSISSNPKFKQNSAKFSFFSSTERMMSEWVKKKGNGAIGAKFDEEKNGQQNGGESDDAGGEESADEQQQPQSDDEGRDEDDTLNFLGLLKHKETPKSKQYAQRNNSRRMSTTNDEYEDTSPCYAFSPKTTLFVCPVPPTLDENGLKCYFLSFGEVRSVVVPFNPITGEHRGFGFVDFVSEHSAKAAYEKRGQIWPRGGLKAFNLTWYRAKRVFSPPLPGTEIFVFELGQKCTESALFSYFGRYGHIEFAQIGHTSDGGRAALIRFTERRSAALAIEGNPEHCEWAKNEAETREQYVKQEETPPMKKWMNVFDLSKSVVRDSSALFRQNRRSADVAQTIQKQFFPDIQKGRSRSVGRFLSTDDDASYNYTPDNKSFTYHGESSPVQFEDENVQAQQHSARRRRNSNQTQNSTGTKRRLVGASSSDDDDSPQRTIVKRQSSREGRSLFRSSVDAKQCNEGKAATAPTTQLHRSRSQKPKNGRNSFAEGGGALLNTPSPSLPSSSTSSLALESSFVSTEGNRQKEVTTNSSSVFRDKYALFNQFLDFLEWKEKTKKSV